MVRKKELGSLMLFGSKAKTLVSLIGIVKEARIPFSVIINYHQWLSANSELLLGPLRRFEHQEFVVRSSSKFEDLESMSNAGAFLSLVKVDYSELTVAIEKVFNSYPELSEEDEVLIQPMLQSVVRSGVAFSHDLTTCSPYRVVNWSEATDTTLVTGGKHPDRIWHQIPSFAGSKPQAVSGVLLLMEELASLFGHDPIDVEFAVTREREEEVLWLLQVRRLVLARPPESISTQEKRLRAIAEKVSQAQAVHPFLVGNTTVFGIMPDWNPAEILGIRPKPLSLSLYRELITDSIWAYQRNNYGYRNLRSFPLMSHFFGLPYIDVRVSFNSFIPVDLSDLLAEKLVNHYIRRLKSQPALHDKIEFEIVFSCYALDFNIQKKRLLEDGFSEDECREIENSLRSLTQTIVDPKVGIYKKDAERILRLERSREAILNSNLQPLGKVYWLIEEVKRYGTLPFAGLARAGFIAIQILKSLVNVGILDELQLEKFLSGLSTVGKDLVRDRRSLTHEEFLKKYGHLRPGTYDILSPRYDENPDLYFSNEISDAKPVEEAFSFSQETAALVDELLLRRGFQVGSNQLFSFIREAIELREFAKFEFTKNLSAVLSEISQFSLQRGFSLEDISHCDIGTLREMYLTTTWTETKIASAIRQGKLDYEETLRTLLPPLITSPQDVIGFEWPTTNPNFITSKRVTARVSRSLNKEELAGCIVCIPNADPGFDWIFSYPISGLITAWGGANSHMAIRANELGIPSIIGAGEVLYRKWSESKVLFIDCANRIVEILP